MHVASRRLIGAIAQLGPADRALLNLWVQRGMDDSAIARLSSAPTEAVAERRQAIVHELADHLGLPPADVLAALARMAHDDGSQAPARPQRSGEQPAPSNGTRRTRSAGPAGSDAHRSAPAGAPATPRAHRAARARRSPDSPRELTRIRTRRSGPRRAVLAGALLAVVLAVAVVVAQSSSGGRSPAPRAAPSASVTPVRSPASSPSSASARPLTPLPGIAWHGRASVTVAGAPAHPTLAISVTALSALRRDHYVAWLYNSISDALPLGTLTAPVAQLRSVLPSDYRRYAFVDVSLQGPSSGPHHSGQSVLRAPLP